MKHKFAIILFGMIMSCSPLSAKVKFSDTHNVDLTKTHTGPQAAGGGIVLSASSSANAEDPLAAAAAACRAKKSYSTTHNYANIWLETTTYSFHWNGSRCVTKTSVKKTRIDD